MYQRKKPSAEQIQRFWLENSEIKMKISNIDEFGEMRITFDKDVTTFNKTLINDKLVNMTVIPN